MSHKIRVAYDISLLGSGYISNQSRTGIFRAVEEIILELERSDRVLVHPISLNRESTMWDAISSLLYCENEQPSLAGTFSQNHFSRLNISAAYARVIKLQKELFSSAKSRRSLRYKTGRAIQIAGSQLAKREAFASFQPHEYDVYHGSYFPLPEDSALPKTPRILTVYDLIPVLFPQFVVPKVHQRTVNMIKSINTEKDWIICISEHTKKDFCQHTNMNPDRVFVIPLAAADYFQPVQDKILAKGILGKYKIHESPYILSLCTLEPRKNLSLLIHAFSDFIREHPNVDLNLVLVGISGWNNNSIFQLIRESPSLRNRVFFTGYVPDSELAPIYSNALAFVYPSLYEGFGLPPLEAMQCGIPVIVSNSSSLPEVVGDAGILISPKRKNELTHAIWEVISNHGMREQLSRKALERATTFSWAKTVDRTVEVYKIASDNKA